MKKVYFINQSEANDPYEQANNKLYFVNLLASTHYSIYFEAQQQQRSLAAIANGLKPSQLKMLIDKIENLM